MDTAFYIAGAGLCLLISHALSGLLMVYVYYRGTSKSSPLPPVLNNIANPPPRPPVTPVTPEPTTACPHCFAVKGWTLSPDESLWTCKGCKKHISGPKPRILA